MQIPEPAVLQSTVEDVIECVCAELEAETSAVL